MKTPFVQLATTLVLFEACYMLHNSGLIPCPWPILIHYRFLTRLVLILILAVGQPLHYKGAYAAAALALLGIEAMPPAMPLHPILLLLILLLPQIERPRPKEEQKPTMPQPTACRPTHTSIALPCQGGLLPVNNPQRGIFVLGNQGSGKTRFVVEPFLHQFIQKGYAGLLYDYDFEGTPYNPRHSRCLTKFAYNCFLRYKPPEMAFQVINFSDLTRSYRINPFAPHYIANRALLEEYLDVLLRNLNPESEKSKDFWIRSSRSLLKSLITFLANRHPQYCTLPHAISLALQPIGKVLEVMRADEEAFSYASSIYDALDAGEKASGQLAGILATFKVSMQLLMDHSLFWVLSGNDISLEVNNKAAPTILCLGNHPPTKSVYSPVIAMLITVCFKAMYAHNRQQSFVVIDEMPTLFIPDFSELPATARKYGVSTLACLQAQAQLEDTYGKVGAMRIEQTLVNKFIGNCEGESAAFGARLMGKTDAPFAAHSSSTSWQEGRRSSTQSTNEQRRERDVFSAQDFMRLAVGKFVGKVAESNETFFARQLLPVEAYDKRFANAQLQDLPSIHTAVDVEAHFQGIQHAVRTILG